jgi:hypothetical protein
VAGNNKSERIVTGNGGKRGRQQKEGLLWQKRSDPGIGCGRIILDLDNKDVAEGGGKQKNGFVFWWQGQLLR